MLFHHKVKTRFNEVDLQGRVFNANWLTYFDEAFVGFIESLGVPMVESELMHSVVVKAVLEWNGSAGYRDVIDITVSVGRVGTSSFDVIYEARVDKELVCTGTLTYVNLAGDTGKSTELPGPLKKKLETARD